MGSKIVTIVCKGETKTLQLKPYLLEEAECEECTGEQPVTKPGKYFCAEVSCLSYFCETCWQSVHFERHIVDRRLHPAYVRMGDQVKVCVFFSFLLLFRLSVSNVLRPSASTAAVTKTVRGPCYIRAVPCYFISLIY